MLLAGVVKMEASEAGSSSRNRLLYISDYAVKYPDTDVAKFDGATLQISSSRERVARLKELNPNLTVLYYRAAWVAWSWEENWSVINAHESWFLHDPQGRRIRHAHPDDAWYVMDLSNPEYRTYIVNYIVNVLETRGFDGVFVDGPTPSLRRLGLTSRPADAVLDAWRSDYALPFLRQLKHALRTKLVVTNSTPSFRSSAPDADDTNFLDHVDGTMIEGFAHAPWDSVDVIPDPSVWVWQQAMMQRNLDRGKRVYVLPGAKRGTPADKHRWRVFSYASFLLRSDGRNAWFQWNYMGPTYTAADHLFPELELDLGAPLGEPFRAQGAWQRDFSRGKVLVNASHSAQKIDVARAQGRQRVDRIELGPWTATIVTQ